MSYLGAKTGAGVYQTIIAQMPPHDTYIEAFAGSAAIFRNKPPASRSVLVERDPRAARALRPLAAETVQGDATSTVASFDYAAGGRVLIYADPPYVLSTRTGRDRYRFELSDADHMRLAAVLRDVPAAVMVSGYPSALYDRLYDGWRAVEFQAMTRGGVRTEKLWMNFPAGPVHWATFAGKNRTRRQNIKRKAGRWAAKFATMEPGERLAVLAALMASVGGSGCAAGLSSFDICLQTAAHSDITLDVESDIRSDRETESAYRRADAGTF